MTQKKQVEGSDVAQIDRILESANQKLAELNLEQEAVTHRRAEEMTRVVVGQSKDKTELTILVGFKDLPRAQEHFEELDTSFADYERLYNMLRSRLFDATGLSKEQRRRALEVQRPLFSDNTDPIFPETIGFQVDPEPKQEKVEASQQPAKNKTFSKRKKPFKNQPLEKEKKLP